MVRAALVIKLPNGIGVNRVVARNNQIHFIVGHNDMPALPYRPKRCFGKGPKLLFGS